MIEELIVCGSKQTDKNFNNLVDSFKTIVRNNMLVNGLDYGERESDIQVLNCHTFKHFHDRDFSGYAHIVPNPSIERFKKYTLEAKSNFITYPGNNTHLMQSVLSANKIPISIHKELRCGLSHVTQAIHEGVKPFVIGFSIQSEDNEKHHVNTLTVNKDMHKTDVEIEILIALHKKNLIDATFCAITDDEELTLNTSIIKPTKKALEILGDLYGDINIKS